MTSSKAARFNDSFEKKTHSRPHFTAFSTLADKQKKID
jgi:hypothetical protein